MDQIYERLLALQDQDYRSFQCRLIPTVDPETVIGVRIPELRRLAGELGRTPEKTEEFMRKLPHTYYDENILHSILISQSRDYLWTVEALEVFLPYVDNWAACDTISPKAFRQRPDCLPEQIKHWIDSGHAFTVRFGIGMLLKFYLDEAFQPAYLAWVAAVRSGEYYVDMMVAWYFATALSAQYTAALPYIEQRRLNLWTHNKAIQKALESRRISEDRKAYLRRLKQKTAGSNKVE